MKQISIFGFGNVGQQLAKLFSDAEASVIICSRDGNSGAGEYETATFEAGAKDADAVVLAIPYTAVQTVVQPLATDLAGKVVIDCTNPLNEDWSPILLGQKTSGAEQISSILANSKIIKAFNTVFADVMTKSQHNRGGHKITAFIGGDDQDAKNLVMDLAAACGFSPLDTGPLATARYLEAMAHLNIQIAVGQEGGTNAAFLYHQG